MDYLLYEAEDFAADDSYLNYYFRTSQKDMLFWEDWIRHHPERLDVITQADHLIALLSVQLPEHELHQEFQRIEASLRAGPEHREPPRPARRRNLWGTLAATAVAALIVWYIAHPHTRTTPPVIAGMQVKTNATGQPERLTLEDGSLVRLDPGSKLSYPAHFAADRREVSIEGSGFFDVRKNAQQPFYVTSGNIVIHVLGTSFTIRKDNEVVVQTGKVEVYTKTARADRVILMPNQRAVYQENDERLETSLSPQPVKADSTEPEVFNTATLADILRNFEQAYAIDIEVDNEAIYHCHFSGDLSHMGLYEQLDVICASLNMTYEVIGTRILIRGKGCNQ